MKPFPDESDLRALFGSAPALLDPNAPWRENALSFELRQHADELECLIEPVYGTLTLRWTRATRELVYLDLNRVTGLSVDQFRGRESLIAFFDPVTRLKPLRIQLRPAIHVSWGTRDDSERLSDPEGRPALQV
ncbi:MAG: hypothetical protein H0U85_04965 [Gemmatimonadales bacterium]|nr:hypothetical protein [Gemmatimonadales bacterium]